MINLSAYQTAVCHALDGFTVTCPMCLTPNSISLTLDGSMINLAVEKCTNLACGYLPTTQMIRLGLLKFLEEITDNLVQEFIR